MTHAEHPPTPEQSDILREASGTSANLMVNALAGCGKSSTLEQIEHALAGIPILFLAFNKKIATDAEKRMAKTTQVRTFNGLGHRIWAAAIGRKMNLNAKKVGDLLREHIAGCPKHDQRRLWDEYWTIVQGVNHAKTVGYIPKAHSFAKKSLLGWDELVEGLDEEPSDLGLATIDTVLLRSIKSAYEGHIDFSDQIYMPALFGGTYPSFPLVMVDEYQDLNPLNHLMISKLAKTRLIGVGDPNQNIYGFRGAAALGMAEATDRYAMTSLPLSTSFRCPETIVRGVHWHVPEMRWSRPGGSVIVRARQSLVDFADQSVILCRNNAPLFALAMRLLAAGRSVSVAGSDVGPKVLNQMKRLGTDDTPRADVISKIKSWLTERLANGSKTAADTAGCMLVFAEHGETLSQAILYAKHLFDQTGSVALMTIHKAKGLEWPTVYLLDKYLIGDSAQERNLLYVAQTRSSDRYFEIDSRRIEA